MALGWLHPPLAGGEVGSAFGLCEPSALTHFIAADSISPSEHFREMITSGQFRCCTRMAEAHARCDTQQLLH